MTVVVAFLVIGMAPIDIQAATVADGEPTDQCEDNSDNSKNCFFHDISLSDIPEAPGALHVCIQMLLLRTSITICLPA